MPSDDPQEGNEEGWRAPYRYPQDDFDRTIDYLEAREMLERHPSRENWIRLKPGIEEKYWSRHKLYPIEGESR